MKGDPPRCRKCDRRLWAHPEPGIGPKCLAREQAAARPPGWTPPARLRRTPARPARTWRGLIPGHLDLTQQETTGA